MSGEGRTSPTLAELFDMDPEERERLNAERMEHLRAAAAEEARLSADDEEALEILADPEASDSATVELRNGVEVDVMVSLPGYVEDMVDAVADAKRIRDVRGLIAEAMGAVILDERYGNAKVWRAYGERFGSVALFDMFEAVVDPALSRRERAGNSHGRRGA